MSDWTNIITNSNLIQHSTPKSVLIKLPKSKLQFWHPAKLCKQFGKKGYQLSIGITPDFKVRLFRTGEGRYNAHETIEERDISGEELIERFKS